MNIPQYKGAVASSAVKISHKSRQKKIIFVESQSDANLINSIFDTEKVCAKPAKGWEGVCKALDSGKKQPFLIECIGFIDKDYHELNDRHELLNREDIVTTVYRDIEIDLIHTEAFKRLLQEKASPKKWTCEKQVIEEILQNLEILSFLRAYNFYCHKNWDFHKIDLSKYINIKSCRLDLRKLRSAFQQNNGIDNNEWLKFEQWVESKKRESICLKSITRGHDATCLLGIFLRAKIGNRAKNETASEVIEENLRLAASNPIFFRILKWYECLEIWGNS